MKSTLTCIPLIMCILVGKQLPFFNGHVEITVRKVDGLNTIEHLHSIGVPTMVS